MLLHRRTAAWPTISDHTARDALLGLEKCVRKLEAAEMELTDPPAWWPMVGIRESA